MDQWILYALMVRKKLHHEWHERKTIKQTLLRVCRCFNRRLTTATATTDDADIKDADNRNDEINKDNGDADADNDISNKDADINISDRKLGCVHMRKYFGSI